MNLDHVLQRADIWRTGKLLAQANTVNSDFDAVRLLMPALSQLSQEEDRWVCWVAPSWIPCAPALLGCGIDLSRVLLVHPKVKQDGLWVIEQSLRSGTCSAVLAWSTIDNSAVLRRLQLAAKAGDTLGFLFRPQGLAEHSYPAAAAG